MWIKNSKQYREETSRKISWGHWFAFFNIIIAIIIGSRYAFLIDWPDTLAGKLYFFVSALGHFSFIVFAVYLLIIFPLSFVIKNHRAFRGLTVILSTICITLLLFDTQVFARFNFHLSSVVWNLLVNPENGELSREWQIFFAPMPIILLLEMLFSRWSWQKWRSLERQKWLTSVGCFFTCCFIATHLIYAWADASLYRPITMQRSNFPLSYPMTARSFLEKHGFLDKEEYNKKLAEQGRLDALKIHYPKQPLEFTPITEKTNILMITVSGLRYDAINVDLMPKLTEFAQNSTQFMQHYSTGNTNNTGLVGLFYGLNANYTDSILSNHTPSILIEKLQAEKYQLGLFSASNFKDTLFKQALFRNLKLKQGKLGNQHALANAKVFVNQQNSDPWFAFVDLAIQATQFEDYQQQLATLDQQLASLLSHISLDNTLVIITAERGLSFSAQDNKTELNNFSRELIQVPMIVHWKNLPIQQQTGLTSHSDLLSALMKNLFGLKNPLSDYSQGKDLFNSQGNNWILVANYQWNVIIQPNGTQYHIDKRGNYKKLDSQYQQQLSYRPPLGLFLEVFSQLQAFFDK